MPGLDDYKDGKIQGELLGRIDAKVDNIAEQLSDFKAGIGSRVQKLEEVSVQNALRLEHHSCNIDGLSKGVNDWVTTKTWITRTVLGTVLLSLLWIVIKKP